MLNRRLLMAQANAEPPGGGIVQDGLVMWLDGTDMGPVENEWKEKINGWTFIQDNFTGALRGDRGFVFTSENRQGMFCPDPENKKAFPINGTFEIAFNLNNFLGGVLFSPNANIAGNQYSVGFYRGKIMYSTPQAKPMFSYPLNAGMDYTMSIIDGSGIINKISAQISNSDKWGSGPSSIVLGGRRGGGGEQPVENGIIYTVRYYNRVLSLEERLQNQQYDIDTYFGGVAP